MRLGAVVILCAYLLIPVVSAGAAETQEFRYDHISRLSLEDIWHSTQHLISGDGVSVMYLDFDREDAPRAGDWIAQGVVLGGSGDLGTGPIAVRLWSKSPSHLDVASSQKLTAAGNAAVAVFVTDSDICSKGKNCAPKRLLFSVTQDGHVLVDGKLIGVIK